MKQVLLSASAPSGNLTIGNYIGAIKNWDRMQAEHDCYFFVVDLHAITTKQDPAVLREMSLSFFAQYLALGLDPQKNCIFFQSHVSEHAELAWVLNCYTSMGALNRMTQFKDKSAKHAKNINAGLFTYPVLMAADILLYQTKVVPVGEDQKQHLELTRDLAESFNNQYGKTFVVPEPYIGMVGARIMSLQEPTNKMSKSDENPKAFVAITDEPKAIMKKVKAAVTDTGDTISYDPETKPGVSNLITIYSVLANKPIADVVEQFQGKMYGHLKVETGELICSVLEPVQKRYHELMSDKAELLRIAHSNAERARKVARRTLDDVYEKIGFVPRT